MHDLKQQISFFFKTQSNISNILGTFRIGKVLGEGGSSIVREASLIDGDEKDYYPKLAIKFLAENIRETESKAFKRFKQAHINLLLVQNSDYILPQIHFDTLQIDDDIIIPYIILKKAEMTLKQYKSENSINFELFEKIFESLLNCIAKIHTHKIIHRDLKPENIFFVDRKIVLGDFDIACFDDAEGVKLINTKPSDRLANYLFSAPEQSEKPYDQITQSADLYALGQILYWLVQDKTLRGQSQISFAEIDERLKKYELLVSNLLNQEPSKRLQSKDEITEFLKSKDRIYQDHQLREKKEQSLHIFDNIIYKYASHLGMSGSGFIRFSDTESIDEIMEDLCKEQESLNLWFSQGSSDCSLDLIKKLDDEKCWLLECHEVKLSSIWVYKHFASFGGSFLVIETEDLTPSGVYKNPGPVEEVGIFDNKSFVSRQEYDTGWAIIDGKRTEVLGNTELRVRYLEPDIHFIAPTWGPIVENIELFDSVYKEYCKTHILTEKILLPLKQVRRKAEVRLYD